MRLSGVSSGKQTEDPMSNRSHRLARYTPWFIVLVAALSMLRCGKDASTGLVDPPRCSEPSFVPAPGTYATEQHVTMASATSGATIHYTLDGSVPTVESPEHTAPLAITENTTIRAIATAPEHRESIVATAAYRIEPCSLSVTAPNGGEEWIDGRRYDIKWETSHCVDWVDIDLYHDGGFCTAVADSTENDGLLQWVAESCDSVTGGYTIQIVDRVTGSSDDSDDLFTIIRPDTCRPTVVLPNGGESWSAGGTQEIRWTSTEACGDSVRVELICDESPCAIIAASTENDGLLEWTVETTLHGLSESKYKIRITDIESDQVDESDATFTIIDNSPCLLQITSPDGNRVWLQHDAATITWSTSGNCGDSLRIELLLDDTVCRVLDGSTPNTGSFAWTIERCDEAMAPYRIRLTDLDSGVSDVSDGSITIQSCDRTITSPSGDETLTEGTPHEITWRNDGVICIEKIRIDLLQSGLVCNTIADSTDDDGAFSWSAQRCLDQNEGYAIEITGLSSGESSIGSSTFSIIPPGSCQPQIMIPNGGEEWQVGTNH